MIQDNANNQRVLFQTVSKFLQNKSIERFPSAASKDMLASRFADFFKEKIVKIQRSLSDKQINAEPSPYSDDPAYPVELCQFNKVTEEEVRALASKPMSKSCNLDSVPSIILKGCYGTLLPIIAQIVNVSLSTGVMSEALKLAELKPTLKKFGADHEEYPNFCPISNLPMISKVVEKLLLNS